MSNWPQWCTVQTMYILPFQPSQAAIPEKYIWIYWSRSNSWIYFYLVLNKNWKIYWPEQSFTCLGLDLIVRTEAVLIKVGGQPQWCTVQTMYILPTQDFNGWLGTVFHILLFTVSMKCIYYHIFNDKCIDILFTFLYVTTGN